MSILKEFKAFAMRGSVIDLAVGVIIGAAFGKIVSSFVNDILMPPIGVLLGGVSFTDIKILLHQAVTGPDGVVTKPAVYMNIGNFIQVLVDFLIIAFAIFMFVKGINSISKKKEEAPAPPPPLTKDQELLGEIRDYLKKTREF
jgi:large conductance mechanosensitive channel